MNGRRVPYLVSLESLEKNNLTLSFGPIIQQTGPNSVTPKALTNSTMERPDNHAQPTFLPSETPPTTDSSLLEIGITNSSAEDTVISQTPFTILNEALSKNDELLNSLSHAQVASPVSSSDSVYDSLVQRETVAVESLPHTFSSSSLDMNVNSLTTIYGQTAAAVKSMSFLPDTTVLPFSQDVLLNPTYTLEEVEHYTSSGATFAAIESTSSPVFLPFEESTAIFPLVLSMQSSDIKPATTTTMLSTSERSSQADSSVGMDSIAVKDVDFSSYFVVEELANAISASSTVSAFFSTSLPFISSSVLYNEGLVDPNLLFTSFVILEIASSTSPYLPDTSKMSSRTDIYTDFLSPVPSVRPRTSCAHCDYTLVPQVLSTESMQQDFGSGDYFETSSLTPSLAGSFTLLKTLSSIPDDFSSEIFYTPFPSRPVVSLSSHLMEESESTVPFSNIGTSVSHSIFAVVSSADIQPPLETRLDLATLNFSFPDTESYYLTPSLTLQLSSEIVSIDLPPFETSTDMTVSTAAFEQTSLLEAPAFKHSESVYYFSTISASNSVEETVELSDLVLSLMSTWSLLETSSLSSLTHNISSDSLVPFFPEGMQTMLATSEFFATHSREISSVSSATESPNIDISLIPPWQTSSLLFPVSYTPKTSSAEDWTTLDFYSPTPLFSEVTSVLTSAHETFFTSTSTEATSLSLSETSLFSFPSSSPTIESPISTLPFLTSSSAIDETLLASSLTFSQPTPTFTLSLPNVSSFQASSNVLGLINPTQVASASSETITGFFPLTSSLNTQPTTTLGTNIVASPTISTAASSSVIIIPPILPSTPPSPSTSSSVPPPTWPPASSSTSQTLKSTLATSPPIPSTSSKAPPVNASSATIPTEGTTKATTTGRSTTHIVSTTAHTTEAITSKSTVVSTAIPTVLSPPTVMTTRQPLVCDINATDDYLVTAVLAHAVVVESLKLSIEDLLSGQFNRSVELELYNIFPAFTFLVISGPFVYTAIAVTNAIRVSTLHCGTSPAILSIQPSFIAPESKYQVQTVLQFVPRNMEIGFCNFTQKLERGLAVAFAEVRRLRQETDDFTIQILNVTIGATRTLLRKGPVNIIFAVRDGAGFLNGSDVSNLLRNLSTVEFSFYLGFPVMQLAEPFYYPQLNTSQLLKDSWLRTVLLGVNDHKIQEDVFQAEMERKLALLISEALVQGRRWKRASNAGSNTVQIVNVSRLEGSDNPVELIYFVEDEYGERLGAAKAADLINVVNIQKAAIILGYRVQGVLAQPLNMVQEAPKDSQNLYIIVGVAVPVALVMVILVILYWKLCRTDKLEFQPDTMSNIQQRQKLQAPTVKGFDFAKQHLGQHNKDDVLIIHEPAPLPVPVKDNTPSENGDVPTPKTKSSSKPSKALRHRGRVTPSDAGSIASGQSSGKESAEETINAPIPLQESKPRKMGKISALQSTNGNEQHSTAAIFEHVDRVSHSSELSRHFPSKIQLIAMQPIAARPMHSFVISDRVAETNKINKEIQTALRHKSEIEHHRNKIRLRAKRKGHYEFPVVDLVGLTDTRERHKMYRKAQMQIDRILDPGGSGPPVYIESRKSSRSKRSPKQRKRHQINGSPPDADRDRLITTDSDGTYKRPPGVSNSAYISDADLVVEPPTPSSCTDLAKFPGSSLHALHSTQYLPPQPSIEEARQTMHSLLDDAFALVAPTSQTIGPTATTLPGSTMGQSITSPPIRAERETTHWGSSYSQPQAINTPFARYVEFGVSPTSVPSLLPRHGYGPGFAPSIEQANQDHQHHLQPEMNYSNRGMYQEEIPSVARPRPIGGTAGPSQIQHLTQVGIASRMGAQLAELPITRAGPMQPGVPSWPAYMDESYPHSRDKVLGHQDYPNTPMFHVPRTSGRQPSAPPAHLQLSSHQGPGMYYPGGSTEDLQPGHTSASLIKAIREELLRLSQKQTAVQNYHS